MFTAMVLICLSGYAVSSDSCIVFINEAIYRTEDECIENISALLNNKFFQLSYEGYELKEYECHSWNDIKT